MKPNQCIILGIDSGKRSGWSIFNCDRYHDSGTALNHSDRIFAYDKAAKLSRSTGLPLVIGRETWTPGYDPKKRNIKTILGMGANWLRWEIVLEDAGFPKSRIFTVVPQTWRKRTLGLHPGRYSREQAKMTAVASCKARNWYDKRRPDLTHDEAEASFIAYFFSYNSRVAAAIKNPGRLKKV